MSKEIVKEFYGADGHDEFNRLNKDAFHRLELNTTLYFLEKYLPTTGHILDAGGGPGRYSLELAQKGYEITHLDIIPSYNEYTKRILAENNLSNRLVDSITGDICNLHRFADNSFDGVICLGGPLSHVVDKEEQEKAVSELIRVAKPDSYIFCSVIGRLALLKSCFNRFPTEMTEDAFLLYRDTGDYHGHRGFTACHFFLVADLRKLFERNDVEIISMVGLEGLSSSDRAAYNELYENYKAAFEIWWQTHLQYCTHSAVVDTSEHILIICRKK